MTVALRGPATGSMLSGHDALYSFPDNWFTSGGTAIGEAAQDVGLPRHGCAAAGITRIKGVFPIPVDWEAVAFRWGWDNEVATAGNVVWQLAYRLVYPAIEGDVDAAAVTTISIGAIAAGNQFDATYSTPASTADIATPAVFSIKPIMQWALSRLGDDAGDTLNGQAAVYVATLTRVD